MLLRDDPLAETLGAGGGRCANDPVVALSESLEGAPIPRAQFARQVALHAAEEQHPGGAAQKVERVVGDADERGREGG